MSRGAMIPRYSWTFSVCLLACTPVGQTRPTSGGYGYSGYGSYEEPPPAAPPVTAAAPSRDGPSDPVTERAGQLREAAGLLDKAEAARGRGAKSYAEQLFSSAELIVGPEAIASLAPLFRTGAPPRVTTPPKEVPRDQPPQPEVVGSSEDEQPEAPRPSRGSLSGAVMLDGHAPSGQYAVITLTPVGGSPPRVPTARVMEQRGRRFRPHILAIPVGSVVAFPNFDPFFHNVFSTSPTKPFDLGLYRTGEAREVRFDREGIVRVGCNLHANMSALIVVVAAPHYVVTSASGDFAFRSLAPGQYTLRAYGERTRDPVTQTVTVKRGKNTVTVDMPANEPKGPLPDKFGVPRVSKSS